MSPSSEDDIVLKLLHTADWHLGKRFRSFNEEGEKKLTRARLEVIDRILAAAERHAVDAVLCAGDLFDEPRPPQVWSEGVAESFRKRAWKGRPVFLLPGNHDPYAPEAIWLDQKFRRSLPDWVHVVDREDFEYALPNGAVLYAVPCQSKSGQGDPTESIPLRAPGDERIRIGMVHGSTFDVKEAWRNFPIDADAAVTRGLDYLAIGDTHGFRLVPPGRTHPPTVYPGAPEPTAFDEKEPGNVAVVLITRQRRAHVRPERVGHWTWEEREVASIEQLRELAQRRDLDDRVLRLHLAMRVAAPDYEEAQRLLQDLEGTSARQGRVGVLELHREGLELETGDIDRHCADLPEVLKSAVRDLKANAEQHPENRQVAERALFHLYRVSRKRAAS